jgi:hypothetical protein
MRARGDENKVDKNLPDTYAYTTHTHTHTHTTQSTSAVQYPMRARGDENEVDEKLSSVISQRQQHLRPYTSSVQTTTVHGPNPLDGQDSPGAINARKVNPDQKLEEKPETIDSFDIPFSPPAPYSPFSPPAPYSPPAPPRSYNIPPHQRQSSPPPPRQWSPSPHRNWSPRGGSPLGDAFVRLSSSPPPQLPMQQYTLLPYTTTVATMVPAITTVPFTVTTTTELIPYTSNNNTSDPLMLAPQIHPPQIHPRITPIAEDHANNNDSIQNILPAPPARPSRTPTGRHSPLPPSVSLPRVTVKSDNNPFAPQVCTYTYRYMYTCL